MTYKLFQKEYQVTVSKAEYRNGGTAIQLNDAEDGFPFATATTWIEGLAENEVAVKDYSENVGMLDFLVKNGIVQEPHRYVNSGFVNIPICTLI
jgi:hypothetical protein